MPAGEVKWEEGIHLTEEPDMSYSQSKERVEILKR